MNYKKYPLAKTNIEGIEVTNNVPNTGSISASLYNYKILKGIREIPLTDLGDPKHAFYAANDWKRSKDLSSEIKENKYIDPLIVVIDDQGPYILEGVHRWVALSYLGIKHIPALVVVDLDKVKENAVSHLNEKLIKVLSNLIVVGIVTQRYREDTKRKEWALVSKKPDKKTGKRRILYWFGKNKPSEDEVKSQEKRIQYFKHKG